MTALYLYRDPDELPEPAPADLADDAARRAYARRCVGALEAEARDGQAFVTTTADWCVYLTLASMFDANTYVTQVVTRARADSAPSAYIDSAVAMDLGEAWFRAYACGPLIPGLSADSPRPMAVATYDPEADAEYQVVLDAVFHASEPTRRQALRDLSAFADEGEFHVDTDLGGARIQEELSAAERSAGPA